MRTGPVCQGTASPAVAVLEYDPQGNVDLRNAEDHSFDLGNRLRQVAGKEWYAYDGHGRRVLSCTSAACDYQQYGFDGKLYLHRDNRANKLFDNIYLGGSLVAIREQPAGGGAVSVRYQHTDALGSPVLVTDQNRAVVQAQTSEYEPYGWPANRAWRDGPGYTGHVEDAATRLTYMQQRYYDPTIGRFLSVDPVTANSDPVGMFNRYRYAANNPMRFTDPDGRMDKETRQGLAEHRAIVRATAQGAGTAGIALGAVEAVAKAEANAWSAVAAKGSGPAAAGALANAADYGKVAAGLRVAGGTLSTVVGAVEIVTANDAGDVDHGVTVAGLGVLAAGGLVAAPVAVGAAVVDGVVQQTEYTSPRTGETSEGWRGVSAAHEDGIRTQHERDIRRGRPIIY